MSQGAYAAICATIDQAVDEARDILTSLPRELPSPPVETQKLSGAGVDNSQDQMEVNCSPFQEKSSETTAAGEMDKMTMRLYRTRSRKNVLVAQYIDFNEPVSDERARQLMAAAVSSSSSSSAAS